MFASPASSRDALSLYENMKGLQETANEFGVSVDIQVNAAKILLGDNPEKTYADADSSRRNKLTVHLEKLTMMCLGILGTMEIEYYADAFARRVEHFTEDLHHELKSEVERIKKQALGIFANQSKHSFEEVQKTYQQSIPYIMGAANLMSRHIAFSNIVVFAKNLEETRGTSHSEVDALLHLAKAELKLNEPKELISTDKISEIEKRFTDEASKL